jgi:HEPN domain-containing protein
VYIALKVRFPYTHSISELLTLVEQAGLAIPKDVRESARLSDYAVEARYLGLAEPVTRGEYEEAVSIAGSVICWAKGIIHSKPSKM